MRWDTLLPKIQSLGLLLSLPTWRERFSATCMEHKDVNEKNLIEKWSGDRLQGLRWEAVSNFCQQAGRLQSWTVPY